MEKCAICALGPARQLSCPIRCGYDLRKLPDGLVADRYGCGSLTGHAQAFRSPCPQWKSWICARDEYTSITMPVTLPTDNYPDDREDQQGEVTEVTGTHRTACSIVTRRAISMCVTGPPSSCASTGAVPRIMEAG